ncbi:hypothetical protein Lboz_2018 [Legionella bozemanae]|uniref:Uncharacterized protein n=1 Tax=Legionella bozemanae TaxID=447 RepID=A0A0W0RQR8_LEGBO|nr:hypothetical protein Lboz_2018 [Legionella bozemanae]
MKLANQQAGHQTSQTLFAPSVLNEKTNVIINFYSLPQILPVNTYNLGVPTPLILGLCEALPSEAGFS